MSSPTYLQLNAWNCFFLQLKVDQEIHFGYGLSLETAKNQAAASALLSLNNDKDISDDNRGAFYSLRDKRRGLIFQSIRKSKGLYDVSVQVKTTSSSRTLSVEDVSCAFSLYRFAQVDFVKYFGRGETQSKANNVCAAKVLAAFESGEHERSTEALYKDAFRKLGEMYNNLLYRTLTTDADKCEVDADKCVVCVNVSLETRQSNYVRPMWMQWSYFICLRSKVLIISARDKPSVKRKTTLPGQLWKAFGAVCIKKKLTKWMSTGTTMTTLPRIFHVIVTAIRADVVKSE